MAADIINNDLVVNGNLTASSMTLAANAVTNSNIIASAAIARSKLALETKKFVIPLSDLRVWDALATNLPGTASSDDLALNSGTFGTTGPTIRTDDVKNTTTTRYARLQIRLPAEYDSAGTVQIRVSGGMVTTVASSSATVDIEAYKLNKTVAALSSDLVSTSAQSINSLTFADKDFTVTSSGLVSGDILDVRLTIAVSDTATVTAVIGAIGSLELLCEVRG